MSTFRRRELLAAAAPALLVGAAASAASASSAGTSSVAARRAAGSPDGRAGERDGALTTPPEAIVATRAGRVRGFERRGICIFRGIPYGAPPVGAARFAPPQPVAPWDGVRTTLAYGPVCPQPARDWSNDEAAFYMDWDDGYPGENCLSLNVWTPQPGAASRLPVIVWIHGGGFTTGSSHELPSYEGSRLAARGAVVVSVNHRLGVFGYLDLSAYGEALADSGNVGMLDLQLALRWVQENIAAFGGDPGRVTLIGQSGGGAKVSCLLAMPEVRGLAHRGVVMSGSYATTKDPEVARRAARELFATLQLRDGDLDALRAVPAARLVEAGREAQRRAKAVGVGWGPVGSGRLFPADAWQASAPPAARDVPLMVGNVRDEFRLPSKLEDPAKLRELAVRASSEAAAPAVLAALEADFPQASVDERAGVLGGMPLFLGVLDQCLQKAALGGAPVYRYWFRYAPALLDGRIGVPHCADIAYFFDNCAACDALTGDTPEAHAVAARASAALLQFAATGRPDLPQAAWPAFTADGGATMVFDRESRVVAHPAARLVATLKRG